jgi:hypothetical protein
MRPTSGLRLVLSRWVPYLVLFCESVAIARAVELQFQSGEKRTGLIELYTSEGCSSCPPAEAWLSKLKTNAGLWKDFVPLAFHVDYWNKLGWRAIALPRAHLPIGNAPTPHCCAAIPFTLRNLSSTEANGAAGLTITSSRKLRPKSLGFFPRGQLTATPSRSRFVPRERPRHNGRRPSRFLVAEFRQELAPEKTADENWSTTLSSSTISAG